MAERRMFAKTIIDSDAFLEMTKSAQCLYFHLAMRADDEGFINKPKSIARTVRATAADIQALSEKKFIIQFPTGVVVIKHWRIHNYLQNDRIIPTKYQGEKSQLELDENKAYRLKKDLCIQNTGEVYTQYSVVQCSVDKISAAEVSKEQKPAADDIETRMEAIKKKPMNEPLTLEELETIRVYEKIKNGGFVKIEKGKP